MRAIRVEYTYAVDTLAAMRGDLSFDWRIIIPELGNLAVRIDLGSGKIEAYRGCELEGEGIKILGEVDVPEDLVQLAVAFADARDALKARHDDFKAVIGDPYARHKKRG